MPGQGAPDPTHRDKLAGRYCFLTDLSLPGAWYAAVVRSPHAHARLISLDVEELSRRPGVCDVVTAADVPAIRFNPAATPMPEAFAASYDKTILTTQPRHVGDGVAVVVASSREAAEDAARNAHTTWQELPAIGDLDQARKAGSVLCRVSMGPPDAARVAAAAPVFIDQTLELAGASHLCLEPHACAAEWGPAGLTVWTNSQSPADIARLVADVVEIPPGLIRIRKLNEGGGFGAKQEMYEEALVSWLARRVQRPVRLTYRRDEELLAGRIRHGGRLRLRAGFERDGRLIASELIADLDAGAYASHTPYVLSCVGGHLPTIYPLARHHYEGAAWLTHTVPAGAYRGYGVGQAASAPNT